MEDCKRKIGESDVMDWYKDDVTDLIDNHLASDNPLLPGIPVRDWQLYRLERKEGVTDPDIPERAYIFYNRKHNQWGREACGISHAGAYADMIRLKEESRKRGV